MHILKIIFIFISDSVHFVKNKFGRSQLIYNGNKYYVNERYSKTTAMVCSQYRKMNCHARLSISNRGEIRPGKRNHNHPPTINSMSHTQ